jgi:hypothetical protein
MSYDILHVYPQEQNKLKKTKTNTVSDCIF